MHSTDFERRNTKSRAIEEALGRLGQPITEGQARNVAALEDCDCSSMAWPSTNATGVRRRRNRQA